jgi:hypothetical protein
MRIYRICEDQSEFSFMSIEEPQEPQEPLAPTEVENAEPKERPDIEYLGYTNTYCVQFRIRDKYWVYWLSFPDWVDKVNYMASKSPARALNWARKKASYEFEVTKDYPMPGSVIREKKLK